MTAVEAKTRPAPLDRRLSVAPMMDWTDRYDRFFLRLITKRTLLYTEMVPSGAILHGERDRFLAFVLGTLSVDQLFFLDETEKDRRDLRRCAFCSAPATLPP